MNEVKKWFIERNDRAREREGNKLDQIMFATASGSIALSLPAVASLKDVSSVYLLQAGWYVLVFSIALMIANYFVAIKVTDYVAEHLVGENVEELQKTKIKISVLDKWIWIFNYLSAVLLIVGIFLLVKFFLNNIG